MSPLAKLEVYAFVESALTEVMEVFPSEHIRAVPDMHRQVFPRLLAIADAAWRPEESANLAAIGRYRCRVICGAETGGRKFNRKTCQLRR